MCRKILNVILFLELKNHSFFDGIDWASVAQSKSIPTYQPNVLEIDYDNPIDLALALEISDDDDIDADLVERFQSKMKHHTE